ncbi:MAG: hypothetical protein AAFP00_11100 [Bacteroidota bacterium]
MTEYWCDVAEILDDQDKLQAEMTKKIRAELKKKKIPVAVS